MKEHLLKTLSRPGNQHPKEVYSNFDHVLDKDVVASLQADSNTYAQHSAANFCGYIWYDASTKRWFEEIWRHHHHLITLEDTDIEHLIRKANDDYGLS